MVAILAIASILTTAAIVVLSSDRNILFAPREKTIAVISREGELLQQSVV